MQKIAFKKTNAKPITLVGPGIWDELTPAGLLAVMRCRALQKSEYEQALILVKVLFNIPEQSFKNLNSVQASQLAAVVNFLFEPFSEMDKWLLKMVFCGQLKLIGPADGLANISMGELMYADENLKRYQKTKNTGYLDKLIASLYRKEGSDEWFEKSGDMREPFNKAHLERNAEALSTLKPEIKQAILHNYICCRSAMAKHFKHVFIKADEEEGDKPAANGNWLDVAIQLARKEHALGTIDQVEGHNAYLVLKVLDVAIKEAEEREKELERLRNK